MTVLSPFTFGPEQWYAGWRRALNRQALGAGQAHIGVFGDSVTQGYNGSTPFWSQSWAGQLAATLATQTGQSAGSGWTTPYDEFNIGDPRTARSGTWAVSSSGGFYSDLHYGSAGATFVFGPITCVSFRVMVATSATAGEWTATVDSGTPTTYDAEGASGLQVVEIPAGSAGSHTLTLTAVSGLLYLVAFEAISNPTSGVRVSRVARTTRRADQLRADANAFASRQCLLQLTDLDLAIFAFGLNEAVQSYSVASFKAALAGLAADVRIGNPDVSVLLITSAEPNPASAPAWSNYANAIAEAADENGCGHVDISAAFGPYASAGALMDDNVHPNAAGHALYASTVAAGLYP